MGSPIKEDNGGQVFILDKDFLSVKNEELTPKFDCEARRADSATERLQINRPLDRNCKTKGRP